MDRYDPNQWTAEFVASNKSFCVELLKDTSEKIVSLTDCGDYKAAIAGLDRMLNGLIVMHNAGVGNCKPHLCGLSFAEGTIIACALDDAPDDKRRDTAIKAFLDARDYSNGGLGQYADSAIDALRSGMTFDEFKETFDPNFPDDTVQIFLSDMPEKLDRLLQTPQSEQKTGGCYIATCVYGSYDCPPVWTLRRYRDDTLAKSWYGRAFIRMYYAVSPSLVRRFGDSVWFRKRWKKRLDRMTEKLRSGGVEDKPYRDVDWQKR